MTHIVSAIPIQVGDSVTLGSREEVLVISALSLAQGAYCIWLNSAGEPREHWFPLNILRHVLYDPSR